MLYYHDTFHLCCALHQGAAICRADYCLVSLTDFLNAAAINLSESHAFCSVHIVTLTYLLYTTISFLTI